MEEQKQIKDYIVDYLLTDEDERLLHPVLAEWLAENTSNRKEFDLYKKIWQESHAYVDSSTFDSDLAWEKISTANQLNVKNWRYLKNLSYIASGVAATLLVVFTLSFMGVLQREPEVLVSMTADYGNRSEIVLPDGSIVKLNSGSEITYSYNAKKNIREVNFQGEGFFDVSKSDAPFVVKTAEDLYVRVRGTSFNLQAYADDPLVQASLLEGCIELEHKDHKLILNTGEIAVFDKQAKEIRQVNGVLSYSYGWIDNKLYMEEMPLSVVCKYLERWYDVKIILQAELGDHIRYNGVIQEETITDVMDALSRLSNICYQVSGKQISITSNIEVPMK